MIQVKEINSVSEFENLKNEWNELIFKDKNSTIFQTWSWQYIWWKYYQKRKKPFILLVYENSQIIGLAPFYIATSYLGLPLKILSFLGTTTTDYLNFIILDGFEEKFFNALFEYLSRYHKQWDIIDLHQISEKSINLPLFSNIVEKNDFELKKIGQEKCLQLPLPEKWEDLLNELPKKMKWNVEYYTRRLKRDYQVELKAIDKMASSRKEIEKMIKVFFDLHQKRWISKKIPGSYLIPKFKLFHHEMAQSAFENNWLSLYSLSLDGEIVAVQYGFNFKNKIYFYLSGFDPDWGKFSVSTVLLRQTIIDAIEEGIEVFDFMRGDEEYKYRWQAVPFDNYRFLITIEGIKSKLIEKILTKESEIIKKTKEKIR